MARVGDLLNLPAYGPHKSHTARHAQPRVRFSSKVPKVTKVGRCLTQIIERMLSIASPAKTIRVGAAESDQGSLPRSPTTANKQ